MAHLLYGGNGCEIDNGEGEPCGQEPICSECMACEDHCCCASFPTEEDED
jgi:hypothetical protein